MNRAAAWNVRGVEPVTRNSAEQAARRDGMSLGEWLDAVVAERAAEQGVDAKDFGRDDRLDAIGERLARPPRRPEASSERFGRRQYRDAVADEPAPRAAAKRPAREPAVPDDDLLGDAIARLEARLSKDDRRATRALETVADWMEHSQNGRQEEHETLETMVDKLEGIEARLAEQQIKLAQQDKARAAEVAAKLRGLEERERRQAAQELAAQQLAARELAERELEAQERALREAAPKREAMLAKRLDEAARSLDQRMRDLAARVDAPERQPAEPVPRGRLDVKDAVAQIAQRRKAFEARAAVAGPEPRGAGWRNFGVDPEPSPPPVVAAEAPRPDPLVEELRRLNRRVDTMQAVPAAPPAPPQVDLGALRAEMAGMSRALGDLAPRKAVAALEGAIHDLSARVAAAQAGEARANPLAPLQSQFAELAQSLRALDPRGAGQGLEREIRAVGAKIDAVIPAVQAARAAPQADVAGLRGELAAMSRSLANLAPRNAVVALEGAIQDLSARVSAIRVGGAGDHLAPLEDLVAEFRQSLRAHDPREATRNLEREIQAIGAKVEAIANGAIDPASFERIRAQTEEVRNLLAAAAQRPVPVDRLERQIGDLADRVEAISASASPQRDSAEVLAKLADLRAQVERSTPASALTSIERRLEQLAARIDQAIARPQAPPTLHVPGFEDLSRRVDVIRETLERRPEPAVDMKPLEMALRSLGERKASVDVAPLERLVSQLDDRIAVNAAQAATGPALEGLLREISAKLDHASPTAYDPRSLEAMFEDLGERLDRRSVPALDTQGIERSLRDLGAKLDSRLSPDVDAALVERAMAELSRRMEPQAKLGPGGDAVIREIAGLHDRFDQMQVNARSQAPLEPILAEILAELARLRDSAAAGQPQAHAPSSRDADGLAREIAGLHDRFDALQLNAGSQPQLEPKLAEILAELGHLRDAAASGADFGRQASPSFGPRDADALSREIAAVHERLDQLQIQPNAMAAIEPMIGEILAELDAMREAAKAAKAAPAEMGPEFARSLADLRDEQAEAGRATQARLAGVHGLLEKIVDRIAQLEDDAQRADFGRGGAPAKAQRPLSTAELIAAEPSLRPLSAAKLASAAIPERFDASRDAIAEVDRAPPRALEGADFLIEPGAAAARRAFVEDKPANSLNAHIAAARRAAQNAMAAETAAEAEQLAKSQRAGPSALKALGPARAFVAARKRPILLGVALFALVTLAVAQLAGSRHAPMQKSEADFVPDAMLGVAPPSAPKADARALDTTTTGSISAAQPGAAPKSAGAPSPELVAAIPAAMPAALRDGAVNGDRNAEYELALRLAEGRGAARDPRLAAQWLQNAADQGLAPAQYRLGSFYEKGVGVTRDLALAKALYIKAADAGNARAMHNLAVLAAEAVGIKPDYTEAASWFRKAGALGVKDSQFNLGILYARGMGMPQDLGQSWLWFSLAAQQGDADAAKKRDEVALKMDPKAQSAAAASLAAFKLGTPPPLANEVPAPQGGWDSGKAAAQLAPTPSAKPTPLSRHAVTL